MTCVVPDWFITGRLFIIKTKQKFCKFSPRTLPMIHTRICRSIGSRGNRTHVCEENSVHWARWRGEWRAQRALARRPGFGEAQELPLVFVALVRLQVGLLAVQRAARHRLLAGETLASFRTSWTLISGRYILNSLLLREIQLLRLLLYSCAGKSLNIFWNFFLKTLLTNIFFKQSQPVCVCNTTTPNTDRHTWLVYFERHYFERIKLKLYNCLFCSFF